MVQKMYKIYSNKLWNDTVHWLIMIKYEKYYYCIRSKPCNTTINIFFGALNIVIVIFLTR